MSSIDNLFETIAEYEAEIIITQDAIRRIQLIGIETENNSGGSMRKSRDTELETLIKYKKLLISEKNSLSGNVDCFVLTSGW